MTVYTSDKKAHAGGVGGTGANDTTSIAVSDCSAAGVCVNPIVARYGDMRCWLICNAEKSPCERRGNPLAGWQKKGATYENAVQFVNGDSVRFAGVRMNAAPSLLALDLDDCLNDAGGVIDPIALALLFIWRTYTEVTPSGRGLRAYALLDGAHEAVSVKRERGFNRELYFNTARFVIVTGNAYAPLPGDEPVSNLATITAAQLDDAREMIERGHIYSDDEELAQLRGIQSIAPHPDTAQAIREIEAGIEARRVGAQVGQIAPVSPARSSNGGTSGLREFVAGQRENNRNNALFWAANRAFESGMSEGDVTALLARDAIATGLTEREVAATIRSAARRSA